MSWSWVGTKYSIHLVQHPSKIVWIPFIFMIISWTMNVASTSDVPLHETSKEKSTCHIPTVASWLSDETSLRIWHGVLSLPLSTYPKSLDYSLSVYLQTPSITISKLARSQPPSVSPKSLNRCLQVYLRTHSTTACMYVSKQARLRYSSSHDHVLQLHLHTCLITTSATCTSVQESHTNLPDTPVDFIGTPKWFQTLPGPPAARQSALRLWKSIVRCSWKLQQKWRCMQAATRFDL
jgi:hypothetical protein